MRFGPCYAAESPWPFVNVASDVTHAIVIVSGKAIRRRMDNRNDSSWKNSRRVQELAVIRCFVKPMGISSFSLRSFILERLDTKILHSTLLE